MAEASANTRHPAPVRQNCPVKSTGCVMLISPNGIAVIVATLIIETGVFERDFMNARLVLLAAATAILRPVNLVVVRPALVDVDTDEL